MKIQARKRAMNLQMTALAEALALAYMTGAAAADAAERTAIVQSAPASRQLAQAESTVQRFDIPPQPLDSALTEFAAAAGLRLQYGAEPIQEIQTQGLAGSYAPERALRILLSGTGLTYRFTEPAVVTLVQRAQARGPAQLDPITVEASGGYAGQFEVDEGFKAEYQSSATKTPLTIRETPQSISVITQDAIKARQATDLGQALETAAGVNQYSGPGPFGGISPFGFNNFQIRGISSDGKFDLREDGFLAPPFYSRADLSIYERVEVVKGPSSVLYGQGSAGGFINQVRKKPLPEFQAGVEADVGSFDFYRAEGDVTGPLFNNDAVRGRLVTAYEDAGSFVDAVESERLVFAPSLEFDLTDSARLLVQGLYQEDRFIGNPGFPLQQRGDDFVAPDIRRSLFVGVPNTEENTWETKALTAQLEQRLGDNWLATLRMNRSSGDFPIDLDSYAYGIQPNGDVELLSSAFDVNSTDNWSGEFRLEGNVDLFDRPATIGFGVEHNRVKTVRDDAYVVLGTANIYEENFADFPTIQPTELSRSSEIEADGTGVYTQLQLRPAERLSVLMGGRYDWADTSYLDRLNDALDEQDDQAFTGRVGLVFDARDNVSAYALHAESFVPVSATSADGAILDPEEGKIYEAGVKTEWLEGRLGVNAAVFRIDRDNVPIPDPGNGPGEFFSISSGVQRSDGVELEINGEPRQGWNLSLGASVLDSEFREEADPFFGSTPAGTADWQLGLYSSYELQGGALRGFGLGAGLFALGDRGVSTFVPDAQLEGYERVDVQAFYNGFERLNIALQLRNVLDQTYVEGADRTGAYAQFGSPLAALLTVEYEFGRTSDD